MRCTVRRERQQMQLKDITDPLDRNLAMRMTWVKEAATASAKINTHAKMIAAALRLLPQESGLSISTYSDDLQISINVTDMKSQVMPVLETLEDIIGHPFDKSEDMTDYGMSERTFKMTGFPLRVVARVPYDGDDKAKCRRVQVGEEIVPKYKLVCDEWQPKADTDIHF